MVTERADQVGHIVSMLDKIDVGIRSLFNRKSELDREIDEIERLGWCDAKPYYRDNKYLYLIYPMQDGERKREYIGSNPEAIEEALARIERMDKYQELINQRGKVDKVIFQMNAAISRILSDCYSIHW